MKTGMCWNGRKSFGLWPNQNLHRRKHWKHLMFFGADLVIFQPEGSFLSVGVKGVCQEQFCKHTAVANKCLALSFVMH